MRKVPTVRFDTSRLTAAVLADLEQAVRELPEVIIRPRARPRPRAA